MIFCQSLKVVVNGIDSGSGQDSNLAHAAPEHLSESMHSIDEDL
jgi:hypothetical protein